jgi:hypothetical protein
LPKPVEKIKADETPQHFRTAAMTIVDAMTQAFEPAEKQGRLRGSGISNQGESVSDTENWPRAVGNDVDSSNIEGDGLRWRLRGVFRARPRVQPAGDLFITEQGANRRLTHL